MKKILLIFVIPFLLNANHPFLLFDSTTVTTMQFDITKTHKHIWEVLLDRIDGVNSPITNPGLSNDIRIYAEILMTSGIIHLLDSTLGYDSVMWEYFDAMIGYGQWDSVTENGFNNHDLTVPLFLAAFSCIYDWFYDDFDSSYRDSIETKCVSLANEYRNTFWFNRAKVISGYALNRYTTSNHFWINNFGVAAVAYAFRNVGDSEIIDSIIDQTETNLDLIFDVFQDDGASHEGLSYHSYGQLNLFLWLDMRDRYFNESSYDSIAWFNNSVMYELYGITPGYSDNYGGVVRFADTEIKHYWPPRTIASWLANRCKNGYAQYIANHIEWDTYYWSSLIWYNPLQPRYKHNRLPSWHNFDDIGIFVWRENWSDTSTYFASKCGSYHGSHEQPDAGTFVIERNGIPFITDCGYSYKKQTNEHNVIMIDSVGQRGEDSVWMDAIDTVYWGDMDVIISNSNYFDIIMNPSPMYKSTSLQKWQREIVCFSPSVFFVYDSIRLDDSAYLEWYLHSYRSYAPSGALKTYTVSDGENPITGLSATSARIDNQTKSMWIYDISPSSWTIEIEQMHLYYGDDTLNYGYTINKNITSDHIRSFMAITFDSTYVFDYASSNNRYVVALKRNDERRGIIVWGYQDTATVDSTVILCGALGGRNYDNNYYFGRSVTFLKINDTVFCESDSLIHLSIYGNKGDIYSDDTTNVTLYHNKHIKYLSVNNKKTRYNQSGDFISFTIFPGNNKISFIYNSQVAKLSSSVLKTKSYKNKTYRNLRHQGIDHK